MYLTRMNLNPRRRGTRKLIESPEVMHAAVMSAFPPTGAESDSEQDARVLWRLDRSADTAHTVVLYISSPTVPDLTHVAEQAGWPTTQGWETRDYDDFLDGLGRGQSRGFRLTANPVHSARRTPGDKDTKVLAHVTVSQQEQWLVDRSAKHGFSIARGADGTPDLAVTRRELLSFHKKGHAAVTLGVAQFDGVLEIEDPVELRNLLVRGLGRAKAYGCGLMTLTKEQ